MARYRVVADVVADSMPEFTFNTIGGNAWVLINTSATSEVDGVDPDLRVERVHSVHQHESTPDYQCPGCRALARDEWNSNSTD